MPELNESSNRSLDSSLSWIPVRQFGFHPERRATFMHGLIGKITAVSGQRDALIDILLEGTQAMPGCLSYIVARDLESHDALWVTEVWSDAASHAASLSLPAVRDAIARGRPLIAGFSDRVVTTPVGGYGLAKA
jgi:quinol monooxygenase YgiN